MRRFLSLLGLLLVLAPAAQAAENAGITTRAPRRFVLAIGINKYDDAFWQPLQYASKDARDVYDFLTSKAGIKFDGGELLSTDAASNGRVTADDVWRAFERLKANNLSEEDTVVVYISTHGTIFTKKGGEEGALIPYFVTSDTNHQNIHGTAIERDKLIDTFQQLRSLKKALIVATCHSGGGKARLTPQIQAALAKQKGPVQEVETVGGGIGYLILSAASWSEPALEDPKLKNDVYTHFLLEGMGRDHNNNGFVTLGEAHDFATRHTQQFTHDQQHPSIRMDRSGADPIVISGKTEKHGVAYLYSYLNKLLNYEVVVEGRSKGPLDQGIQVPAGKHRIDIIDPKTGQVIVSRVARFDEGKEYSVLELLNPRRPNLVESGAIVHKVLTKRLGRRYAPETQGGYVLRGGREEAVSIYDLSVALGFFPGREEKFDAGDGYEVTQRRAMLSAALLAGSRERVALLSSPDNGLDVNFRWGVGPSALLIDREILDEDAAAFADEKQRAVVPGLTGEAGLVADVAGRGLRFGIGLELAALSAGSVDAGEKGVATAASAEGFIGFDW